MNTTKIQQQEYNRFKRKYEEVVDNLEKAELLCLQLKGKASMDMSKCEEFPSDEESRLLYQLQTRQDIIQDLRYECQSKKQRIEQLEQTVQLVNKIQEDNGKLIESNAVYKDQFTSAVQMLQSSITQQELQAVQVKRLICNFIEELKQKLYDYERVQISMEKSLRKMLNLSSSLKQQNNQLKLTNESMSKTLKEKNKEIDDLHIELSNNERKYEESLHKSKMQYEDRILRLSSELELSCSSSMDMYKRRMAQQKMEYEKEITELKKSLALTHEQTRASTSAVKKVKRPVTVTRKSK